MEDGDSNQEHPQPLPTNHDASSPKKPSTSSIVVDRLKRDEWSEGAVSSLLEAYETKWALRNRAKLKGQDWEDVARHVSSRASHTKSPKTQTQCKNKIESMKKRYRSESATANGSSSPWKCFHLCPPSASASASGCFASELLCSFALTRASVAGGDSSAAATSCCSDVSRIQRRRHD